jgi:2,3-diaminopropionate biosynthesis protein SbnB
VVPGDAVSDVLEASPVDVIHVVADAYLAHEQGTFVNPRSYFMRFPEKPNARVIALPAYLGNETGKFGIKWISSFPDNVKSGMSRASAVLLINDYATGHPLACLEAAKISAARTAASAAIATAMLVDKNHALTVSFVGAGVIARTILDYLIATDLRLVEVVVHDLDEEAAEKLATYATEKVGTPAAMGSLHDALGKDLVVFATTAAAPYVPAQTQLSPGQVLLNISLRDLPAELLLTANNIVDDVDHCLRERTSPHLAELVTGNRDFITGQLGALLAGDVSVDPRKATIFSPFGLGILDLAVGQHVLTQARAQGATIEIPHFMGETRRW